MSSMLKKIDGGLQALNKHIKKSENIMNILSVSKKSTENSDHSKIQQLEEAGYMTHFVEMSPGEIECKTCLPD